MSHLKRIQQSLNDSPVLLEKDECTLASVAICFRERNDDLEVLFMRRALDENDPWSGHICFPGGRVETTDSSSQFTAERETQEEVGLTLDQATFLGRCDDAYAPVVLTKTAAETASKPRSFKQVHIAVYAYMLNDKVRTQLNDEVSGCAWVSIKTLADVSNSREIMHPRLANTILPGIAITAIRRAPEPVLWGLSLRILFTLFSKLDLPLAADL